MPITWVAAGGHAVARFPTGARPLVAPNTIRQDYHEPGACSAPGRILTGAVLSKGLGSG